MKQLKVEATEGENELRRRTIELRSNLLQKQLRINIIEGKNIEGLIDELKPETIEHKEN